MSFLLLLALLGLMTVLGRVEGLSAVWGRAAEVVALSLRDGVLLCATLPRTLRLVDGSDSDSDSDSDNNNSINSDSDSYGEHNNNNNNSNDSSRGVDATHSERDSGNDRGSDRDSEGGSPGPSPVTSRSSVSSSPAAPATIAISATRWPRPFSRLYRLSASLAVGLSGLPADCALCLRKLRRLQRRHRHRFGGEEEMPAELLVAEMAQWMRRWLPDRTDDRVREEVRGEENEDEDNDDDESGASSGGRKESDRDDEDEGENEDEAEREEDAYVNLCERFGTQRPLAVRLLLAERSDGSLTHRAEHGSDAPARLFKIRPDGAVTVSLSSLSSHVDDELGVEDSCSASLSEKDEEEEENEEEEEEVKTLWATLRKRKSSDEDSSESVLPQRWQELSCAEMQCVLQRLSPGAEYLVLPFELQA